MISGSRNLIKLISRTYFAIVCKSNWIFLQTQYFLFRLAFLLIHKSFIFSHRKFLLLSITSTQLFFHWRWFFSCRNFLLLLFTFTLWYKKKGKNFFATLYPTGENRLITVSRRSQLIMEWMKSFLTPQPPVLFCVVHRIIEKPCIVLAP
jgi:hypothetical protein